MKILLFGATGQVGHELRGPLATFAEVVAPARTAVDLTDPAAVGRAVREAAPDWVVNAAADADVDRAEADPAAAARVNADAVGEMAAACAQRGAALLHLSTDYVFDGEKGAPYVEDDAPNPLSAYARTKLDGERAAAERCDAALVLRTSWVHSTRRPCFVTRVLDRARRDAVLRAPTDQCGSPTFCRDLAFVVAAIVRGIGAPAAERAREAAGVYHAAGSGAASRLDFTRAVLELHPDPSSLAARRVEPAPTASFASRAPRPRATPLDCAKLERVFGLRLPPWRDGLARALARRIV